MQLKHILIIGNLNSGKTSIAKKLVTILALNTISIDDLRIKYGDGTFSKEYLAWSNFFEIIENEEPIILEFSGAGIHKHPIKELLNRSKNKWLIIFIKATYEDIINRMSNKKLETPYPWKISGFNNLKLINEELEEDWKKNYWANNNIRTMKVENTSSIEKTFNELTKKINLLSDE